MNYEKSCGCIVLNKNNEILLVHHVLGHWDFPKGHVDNNETEEETAIREVKEETNIDVIINRNYRYTIKYSPKEDVIKEVVFFIAYGLNTKEYIPQIEEVQEVKWFNVREAINTITYDNSKELLKKVIKDLKI